MDTSAASAAYIALETASRALRAHDWVPHPEGLTIPVLDVDEAPCSSATRAPLRPRTLGTGVVTPTGVVPWAPVTPVEMGPGRGGGNMLHVLKSMQSQ